MSALAFLLSAPMVAVWPANGPLPFQGGSRARGVRSGLGAPAPTPTQAQKLTVTLSASSIKSKVKVTVNKKDPGGKPLAGVKFGIADTYEHAKANPPKFLSETMNGSGTDSMNGDGGHATWELTDTATTGDDGTCTFTGLPFSLTDGADYWLREITAPDGYGIVDEPVHVHVGDLEEAKTANYSYSVEVTDSPTGFLPNTGGVRSYAAIAAGAAVVAAGVGGAAVVRHRRAGAREDDGQTQA
ncbi:MAG: prealbumin-like fold domain-containing protein [Coriobacteriales bacterium]|jgi:LPXTG-motif cell wall-anchored protein